VYLELGRREAAVEIYRALQTSGSPSARQLKEKIDSTFPDEGRKVDALLLTGVYVALDRGLRALPFFRRVLMISQDPAERGRAQYEIGCVYEEANKAAKAATAFQQSEAEYVKAVRSNPRSPDLQLGLALAYVKLGRKQSALEIHKTLATLDPKQAEELRNAIDRMK
jgi:tetratricopeptide (TPR) repeat protein